MQLDQVFYNISFALPSLKVLGNFAIGSVQLLLSSSETAVRSNLAACPHPQLSCHNQTIVKNTCCFNSPGGQLLQTQFWDTDPATGQKDHWTVHGLWPDHCDGTFDQYCDSSRDYSNISAILQSFGKTELLKYMNAYWQDYQGMNEKLWTHEWQKHGTCISTLYPDCYPNYRPQHEVVDFFNKTIELFKTLDSYQFLAKAGITPTSDRTYTKASIETALKAAHGAKATIQCKGRNRDELREIWYHFNVRGSVQTGQFVTAEPDGPKSDCPGIIKYLPKKEKTHISTTATRKPTSRQTSKPGPTGRPFEGRGYLNVEKEDGAMHGCIISYGTWYATGTCAAFMAQTVHDETSGTSFALKGRKGYCTISDEGVFNCERSSGYSIFNRDGNFLQYNGSAAFYADTVPTGTDQEVVYTKKKAIPISISWQLI